MSYLLTTYLVTRPEAGSLRSPPGHLMFPVAEGKTQ